MTQKTTLGWTQTWASALALQHMGGLLDPGSWCPVYVFSLILFLSFLRLTLMNYVHSLKGSSGDRMQLGVHTLTRIVCNPTIVK